MLEFQTVARYAVIGVFAVSLIAALASWLVRTQRVSPFGALGRALRAASEPLIRPVERRLVRAGGNPVHAGWWLVVGVAAAGVVLLSLLNWLGGPLVGAVPALPRGTRGGGWWGVSRPRAWSCCRSSTGWRARCSGPERRSRAARERRWRFSLSPPTTSSSRRWWCGWWPAGSDGFVTPGGCDRPMSSPIGWSSRSAGCSPPAGRGGSTGARSPPGSRSGC